MLFAFFFLEYPGITSRTWLLYGFVLLINAGVIAGVVINPRLGPAQLFVGLATFLHLAVWTTQKLRPEALGGALAVYFIFGALHSVFPIVGSSWKPGNTFAPQGSLSVTVVPAADALVLMLLPVPKLPETSFIVWPAMLLVDALAIIVAVTTSMLIPVMAALVLTLIVAGAWLFKVPVRYGQCARLSSSWWVASRRSLLSRACWLAKRFALSVVRRSQARTRQRSGRLHASRHVRGAPLCALLIMAAGNGCRC